jgi:ABC-type nitrate/sulfonate/bicarbonate transport system permease component
MARHGGRIVQLGFLLVLVTLWQLATTRWHVAPILLPKPVNVGSRLMAILQDGSFVAPLTITLSEVAAAFLLAAASGLLMGFTISRTRRAVAVFEPLLTAVNAVPAILFFPLFTLFFGLGSGSKIALGATIAFFPIVLNTITGFGTVERLFITASVAMGASGWALFRHVLLPSAFPTVLAGLRMGLVLSFLAVLGGETIASFDGLGHQIADAADSMEAASMYAYILIVIAVAAVLNVILSRFDSFGQRP